MKCVSPYYNVQAAKWCPCGKCNFCLKQNRAGWAHRLFEESKAAFSAAFLTFTYDEASAVYDIKSRKLCLEKSHMVNLMKRIRKREWKRHRAKAVRYYLVGEYGGETGRPHYHALLFNLHQDTLGTIADIWGKGFVHHGKVEPASIMYVCGYIINKDDGKVSDEVIQFPYASMSKGIGRSYLTPAMKKSHKRTRRPYVVWPDGIKGPLARYYKDKIFTKLDKEVIGTRLEAIVDRKYQTEIERLRALVKNPEDYYRQMEESAYKRVRMKKSGLKINHSI